MPARMRTDEPEINEWSGTASPAQARADDGDGSLIGPPPPSTGRGTQAEQTGTPNPDALPDPDAQADETDTPAEAVELQRSTEEPLRESTAATGFWDVSKLTGSSGLSGILMAGGVLIIVVILLRRLWRGKRRRHATDLQTPREQIAALRSQAEDRGRINAFKNEAHDFTRQLAALLDTKAERLEQLIADADDRLARLARLEGAQHGSAPPRARSTRNRAPSIDPPAGADPAHARIYQLADSGMDPVEIARQTGQPPGQVELILALRG